MARPRPNLVATVRLVLGCVVVAALLGLWAARNIYRWRNTPDTTDIDSAYFDPHGVLSVLSVLVALGAVAALPPLWMVLARVRCKCQGTAAGRAVCAAAFAGGIFWVAVGLSSVWLDASTAEIYDPMIRGPKGSGALTVFGYFFVFAGVASAVAAVLFAAAARFAATRATSERGG